MSLSAPTKIATPFATGSALKNAIPSTASPSSGLASYTDGWQAINKLPLTAGGIAPYLEDFNGVLFEATSAIRWLEAMTGAFPYDSAYAAAVGGYPIGACVLRSDGLGLWITQTANNTTDPEAGGAGWVPLMHPGNTAVTMTSANVTLTSLQAGKEFITITGTLTGNLNLVFPTYVKNWIVVNNTTGAFAITAKTSAGTGVVVPQGGATHIYGDGTNINAVTVAQRTRLSANDTLYVATTGSDTTGTGAVGTPFATAQHAYDYAQNNYDLNGVNLIISIAAGTYTAPVIAQGSIVGQTQQANVIFNGAGATTIFSATSTSAISAYGAARITLQNMLIQTTSAGDCVNANGGATIAIGTGVTFGACGANHLSATDNSTIFLTANYSISGSGANHMLVSGGQLLIQGGAVVANVTTPVGFGNFANASECGLIKAPGWSVTGSAVTGTRYTSTLNAVINTSGGGANYFPGNVAGSTATGGQYA